MGTFSGYIYRKIFFIILLLSFLFPVLLTAGNSETRRKELEKYLPANSELVIFFDLPVQGSGKGKQESSSRIFRKEILANIPVREAENQIKIWKKIFSDFLIAVYTGNDKNGMVFFHTDISNEEFLNVMKSNAGKILAQSYGNRLFYTGKVPDKTKKEFLFTFPGRNIVVFTENTPQQKEYLFRSLQGKKGLDQSMRASLNKRRKNAFIYGAAKAGSMEQVSSGIFPDAKNLRGAAFDVAVTKENILSLNILVTTSTAQTAEILAMLLNNYKTLLAGILAGGMDFSGTGNKNNMNQIPDPSSLVRVILKGKEVQILLNLPPNLLPVLQNMFQITGEDRNNIPAAGF